MLAYVKKLTTLRFLITIPAHGTVVVHSQEYFLAHSNFA